MKDFGCCLTEILILAVILYVGYSSRDWGKEYLVEKTNYIHSTNNPNKCRFVKIAKERDYKISRISKKDANYKEKKMCKFCYTAEEQKKYNQELRERKKVNFYWEERKAWVDLLYNNEADFSKLYVYMEYPGKLHISGNCSGIEGTTTRLNFRDIESIETTCEDCVDREYVDFIYYKINNGVYDISQIKEVDEDY